MVPLRSCPLSTICAPSAAVAVFSGLPAAASTLERGHRDGGHVCRTSCPPASPHRLVSCRQAGEARHASGSLLRPAAAAQRPAASLSAPSRPSPAADPIVVRAGWPAPPTDLPPLLSALMTSTTLNPDTTWPAKGQAAAVERRRDLRTAAPGPERPERGTASHFTLQSLYPTAWCQQLLPRVPAHRK